MVVCSENSPVDSRVPSGLRTTGLRSYAERIVIFKKIHISRDPLD